MEAVIAKSEAAHWRTKNDKDHVWASLPTSPKTLLQTKLNEGLTQLHGNIAFAQSDCATFRSKVIIFLTCVPTFSIQFHIQLTHKVSKCP